MVNPYASGGLVKLKTIPCALDKISLSIGRGKERVFHLPGTSTP